MDYLGSQAKSAGLPDEHKRYLDSLAKSVPRGSVKKTLKETAWQVAQDGKIITINALVADQKTRAGWMAAIKDFQAAATKQ